LTTLEPKHSNIAAEDAKRDTNVVSIKSRDRHTIVIRESSSNYVESSVESKHYNVGSGVKLNQKLLKGHEDFLAIAQRINYTKTLILDSVKKDILMRVPLRSWQCTICRSST